MNAAEKNVLYIALALFLVGCVVRVLPWGLPSIEQRDDFSLHSEFTDKLTNGGGDAGSGKPALSEKGVEGGEVVASKTSEKRSNRKKKSAKVALPIRINSANQEELCALKGVGPKLAEKILEVRTRSGPFKSAEDLKKVPGIGKKKLEGLLPGVIFD